jgi:hypothetical protein
VPQYSTGELIYPVEVTETVGSGASHYSQSRAAGGFHTDGTLLPEAPEIAALLGLSHADVGGETVLMDGRTLYDALLALGDRHVETLAREQPFDLMGQSATAPTKRQRILVHHDNRVELHYLRYYIERGYARLGELVPDALRAAMDALDGLAADEAYQQPALLRRGDLLVWDNRRFLHGRRDFVEIQRRRRLRRMYGMHRVPAQRDDGSGPGRALRLTRAGQTNRPCWSGAKPGMAISSRRFALPHSRARYRSPAQQLALLLAPLGAGGDTAYLQVPPRYRAKWRVRFAAEPLSAADRAPALADGLQP